MTQAIVFLACCSLAFAQSGKPVKLADTSVAVKPAAASSTTPTTPLTSAKWDYFTSVTIPAGQTVNLESTIDFSSSDIVRVTVRSAGTDLLNLLGTAYFTVPNATEFVTQEVMLGSDFFYSNSGGAGFQVCGPQFRLALRNLGSTTLTLTSVLIYTRVQ